MRELNVRFDSSDWRACALANFPIFPFTLDGVTLASTEGFVQGIKFPPGDLRRPRAFRSFAWGAKEIGDQADRKHVWWNGRSELYGSSEHHNLIARAIRAKFAQNRGAQAALQATRGLVLVHRIGVEQPTTSLPASVFCDILHELRSELLSTGTINEPQSLTEQISP